MTYFGIIWQNFWVIDAVFYLLCIFFYFSVDFIENCLANGRSLNTDLMNLDSNKFAVKSLNNLDIDHGLMTAEQASQQAINLLSKYG